MATHTTWNKARGLTLAPARQSDVKPRPAPRMTRDHLSFYLVFALFAAALSWLLSVAFDGAGLVWRGEYALWAAVPACALTVLVRFGARERLRG